MHPVAAVLACLDGAGGSIQGRTKLQKVLYFVSELLAIPEGYAPHFYGPYSPSVASAVSSLANAEFIREDRECFSSNFAGNDFPTYRFSYSLTEKGKRAVEAFRAEKGEEFSKFSKLTKEILGLSDDYILLSYAAKVYCILEKSASKGKDTQAISEVAHSAKDFGWKLSESQISEGVELLQKIVDSSSEEPEDAESFLI
jgi:uncharacterized protein YwgA